VTEVFEGATVIEPILEEVDDFFVGDVNYGRTLVEEALSGTALGVPLNDQGNPT
jgi:hypothetical protein